jgi:hypothetical protein
MDSNSITAIIITQLISRDSRPVTAVQDVSGSDYGFRKSKGRDAQDFA